MTPEARLAANIAIVAVGLGSAIGACAFAWLKGRAAERRGATLYFSSCALTWIIQVAMGPKLPPVSNLIFDALIATGFLFLALRYNSLWLGGAMMLKGVQLALHASHLTDDTDPRLFGANAYLLLLDVVNLLICMTIVGGTLASVRARRTRPEPNPVPMTPHLASG